jgi:O-antigen/teichoic acid export membrane protein
MLKMANFMHEATLYIIARCAVAAISLITLYLFSRLIPAYEYGYYTAILAASAAASAVLFDWLGICLLRLRPSWPGDGETLVSTVYFLFVSIILVVLPCFLACFFIFAKDMGYIFIYAALIGVGQAWFALRLQLSASERRAFAYTMMLVSRSLLLLLLGCLSAIFIKSWHGLALATAAAYLLPISGTKTIIPKFHVDLPSLKIILRYGWPLAITLACIWIVEYADRLILIARLTSGDVGRYALASDAAKRPLLLMMTAAATATLPAAAAAHDGGRNVEFRELLKDAVSLLFVVGMPILVVEMIMSRPLSRLFLGSDYAGTAAQLMPIVALSAFVSTLRGHYIEHNLHLSGRTSLLSAIWLVGGLCSLGLSFYLIQLCGSLGAAIANLSSTVLLSGLMCAAIDPSIPQPWPTEDLVRIAIAAAIMGSLLYLIPGEGGVTLLLRVILGIVGYLISVFVLDPRGWRTRLLRGIRPKLDRAFRKK